MTSWSIPVNSEQQGSVPPRAATRGRRLAIVAPVGVGLATLGVVAWSAWPMLRPARAVSVTQVVFDPATAVVNDGADADADARRDVPTVQAAGWLEAEPYYVAATALADGVVEEINVLAGEYVEQGAVVARLVAADSELRLRQAEAVVADKEAELRLARAELAAAERNWAEPVELERGVETARAALAEARAELEQLPALVAGARATVTRLQEEYERVEATQQARASAAIELIIARQRYVAQQAEVEALEKRRPLLAARVERLAAELRAAERHLALRIEDRRRLESARAAGAAAEAEVARARAERDVALLELDRMVIRAPISGYVQRRLKAPGDKVVRMMDVRHSAHLVHLYDPHRLQVRVDVPLADAAHVYPGQACEVVVEVLPDRVFRGEVLRSTHEADLQKNTLEFKVKVIDPDPVLRPEMLTRVKFLPPGGGVTADGGGGDTAEARVLIPVATLDERGERPRVWVVTDRRAARGVLRPVAVELLGQREGWLVVRGALAAGALVTPDFAEAAAGETVEIRADALVRAGVMGGGA